MAAKHILVVTADPDVARVLATALELAGADVGIARSPALAVAHFREQPTQVVIIDLGGLAEAGVELCTSIRALTDGAVVPMIMVGTGREPVATLADALAAGADYFFRRPIEAVRVVSRVLTYLGGGSTEAVPADLILGGAADEVPAATVPELTEPALSNDPPDLPRDSSLSAIDAAIDDALHDALAAVPARVRPASDREPTVVGPVPTDDVAAVAAEAAGTDVSADASEPSVETSDLISRLKRLQQATHSTQRHSNGSALEALVDELIAGDRVSVAARTEPRTADAPAAELPPLELSPVEPPAEPPVEPAVVAATPVDATTPPATDAAPATIVPTSMFSEVTLPDLSLTEQVAAAGSDSVASESDAFARQRQEAEALRLEIDRLAQRESAARESVAAAKSQAEEQALQIEAEARQRAAAKAQEIESEAQRQAEAKVQEIESAAQQRADARAQEIESAAQQRAEAKAQEIEATGRQRAEATVQELEEEAQRKAEARARELEDAVQRQVDERAQQLEAGAKQRAAATAQQLEIEVRQRTADRDSIAAEVTQRAEMLAQLDRDLKQQASELSVLDEGVKLRRVELAALDAQADQSADEIAGLEAQLVERRHELTAAEADVQQRLAERALLETAATERTAELATADAALRERRAVLEQLSTATAQQQDELAKIEAESRRRASELQLLDEQGRALADAEGRKLAAALQERENELQQLTAVISLREQDLQQLDAAHSQRVVEAAQLQEAQEQAAQAVQAAALEQAQRGEELAELERAVAAQRAEFERLEEVGRQSALERQQRAEQEQQQAAAELQRLDDEVQRHTDALHAIEQTLAQREAGLRQQEDALQQATEQLRQADQAIAQQQSEATRRREAGAERLRQGAGERQRREERARQWFSGRQEQRRSDDRPSSAAPPSAPAPAFTRPEPQLAAARLEPLPVVRDDRPSLSAVAAGSPSWVGAREVSAAPELPSLAPLEFVPLQPEEGALDDAQLPTLLAEIHLQRVTGRVDFVLESGRAVRTFYFEAGEPVHVRSNLRHDQFAEFLLRRGLLTREQHALARAKQLESARQLGAALLEEGVLKTRELFDAVREHLADAYLTLLEWPQASFRYLREHVPEVDRVVLAVSAGALVAEGVRRKYDVDRLLHAVGGPATLLAPVDLDRLAAMQLRPEEQRAADLLDGVRTLEDLILAAGVEETIAYRTALIAIACGAHEVAARGVDIVDADRALAAEHEQAIDRGRLAERLRLAREANYFDFLGLPRTATGYEIETAVGQLLEELDRIRLRCADERAINESVAEIGRVAQDAYSVLRNDHQRERYRRNLRA